MVNAKELRSGNLLQGKLFSHPRMGIWSNGITRITAYGIAEIESGNIAKDYQPIPLNDDILLKCGFESSFMDDLGMSYGLIISDDMCLSLNDWTVWIGQYDTHIHYLHQLQNLYFSLTGKELEVNL